MTFSIRFDAFGIRPVFLSREVGRKFCIFGNGLSVVLDVGVCTLLNHANRVVERMLIHLISSHSQCVARDIHGLIVTARDAKLVETVVKLYVVVLWRAVADRIDRCGGLPIVRVASHTSVGMFVALQHEVHTIFLDEVVEHPALNQVVVAFQREERVVKHHNLPAGGAVLELFFQPVALGEEVRKLAVAV